MADALSWLGGVTGVIGVVLAVVALVRTTSVMSKEPFGDLWKVTNQGPVDVFVTRAYVIDEDRQEVPLGQWVDAADWDLQAASGQLLPTEGNPWCRGRVLMPQEPFTVEIVSVSRSLHIKYRVRGFLGFLSRGSLTITGGP